MNPKDLRHGVAPVAWNALAAVSRPSGNLTGQSLTDPTALRPQSVVATEVPATVVVDEVRRNPDGTYTSYGVVWASLQAASVFACFVHGYRRNHGSVGWGLGWALFAGLFPVIAPALAVAEGYARPIPLETPTRMNAGRSSR